MQTRMLKNTLFMTAVAAGLGLAAASRSDAALTITLSEPGFAPVTVTDTGNTGTVSNFTSYGTFNVIDVEVAVSDRLQSPTPAQATLQVTAILEGTTAGGTLSITTTDSGYTFPGVTGNTEFIASSMGGTLAPATLNDTVTFLSTATATTGVAASNVSTGVQTYFSPGSSAGTNSFSTPNASTTFIRGSSFDLTNQLTVTLNSGFEQANLSGTTTVSLAQPRVPEPASATLLAIGAGSYLLRRRRTM